MLHLQYFTFNAFQENTYLVYNEKNQCWIIDPGMYHKQEIDFFIAHITKLNLKPQAIYNTHTHIDHIMGVQSMVDKYTIPFYTHRGEQYVLDHADTSAAIFGFDFPYAPKPDGYINEKEIMIWEDDELSVFHVPGHSPGSLVFYYPAGKWAICGDVLFSGSIGRTDLPGGDHETLIAGIKDKLLTLPPDTVVYSGHGEPTTIGEEKSYNPFLR